MKNLFLIGVILITIIFNSCAISSYAVQVFTDDNIVLADTYFTRQYVQQDKKLVEELVETTAIFRGKDLEDAMRQAREAGFTKILSIETWSDNNLFIIPVPRRQVVIRATGFIASEPKI